MKTVTIEKSPNCLIFGFPLEFDDLTGGNRKNKNLFTFVGILELEFDNVKYRALSNEWINVYLPIEESKEFLLYYYCFLQGNAFNISPLNFDMEITNRFWEQGLTSQMQTFLIKEGQSLNYSAITDK